MAAHYVICKYCSEKFNRDAEPFVTVGGRRYAHKNCAEKYYNSISQDEKDYEELERYIKKLFKINTITVKIRRQIKEYREQYNYTYSGIQKTLHWWFIIKNNPLDKANDGIGIVPYVYDQCKDYYYRLYLAKAANEMVGDSIPKAEVQKIEIGSPRVYVNPPKLFKFDEEQGR